MMEDKQTVLVIDDDKINLQLISEILRPDVNIIIAKSGQQGIQKALEHKPDLILLDIVMPMMDGFETMHHLNNDVRTCAIPVIFITSLNDTEHEEKGLLLGASDYIPKPLHSNIVHARVRLHLQLSKQRKMLERLANIDPLTSLANRRKYQDVLSNEWKSAIMNKKIISLLIIDIDNFKEYNDCYGHATGDKVLQQVASVLAAQVDPEKGLVARYGGEEFVIVLSDCSKEESIDIANRCLREVENLSLHYNLNKAIKNKVTVSVGGATHQPTPNCQADAFFNMADDMLYLAKQSGKNGVMWKTEEA